MSDYIETKTIERDDQTSAPKPELVSEQSTTGPEKTKNLKRSSSYEFLPPSLSELKLVLLGNSWRLRASVGNLLLGNNEFTADQECVKGSGTFQEKELTVICTPDQQLNNSSQQDIKQFIQNIKDPSSSDPHVFLLVLKPEDFTEQHKNRLESVLESFSEEAFHHSLVLMLRSEKTKGSTEKYMREAHIRDMIRRCRYRYLWMDYNDLKRKDLKEFKHKELFSRICDMLKENKEIYGPSEEKDSDQTCSIKNKPSLNLVLFGRSRAEKISVVEFILGRAEFPAESPEQCVKHEGEVSGRRVSLVELPSLSGKPLETVIQLCLDCLSLCGPEGVHAFILVIPGRLTNEDKEELKILQKTLGSRVRDFTVSLISVRPHNVSVKSSLRCRVNLDELSRICGGGALCLNIKDPREVTELRDTIDKLTHSGAGAYTKDMFLEAVIQKVPKFPEMNLSPMPLRIALIGKNNSGKSASANTILREKFFQPKTRTQSYTTCEMVSRMVQGRTVTVVIMPPLYNDSFSEKELSNCISQVSPGPHAFLLLLPIGKINEQDQNSLELIKNRLGEKVADYVIVVFTGGEVLDENYTIKNYIEECGAFVKDMLKECEGRYLVLNTNEINDTQVAELLKMIDKMAQKNSCFTQEMLKMNEVREELKEIRDQLKEAQRKIQEKENIETELERLKVDAKKAEIQNRKVVEDKSFWIKICLFAILFLLLAIYISATHNNKAIFNIN